MMIEPAMGSAPGVKEKFRIEAPKPVGFITGGEEKPDDSKGKEKEKETNGEDEEMAVVLKATSVEEATQAVMAPRKDTRAAGVHGWNFKVRSSLPCEIRYILTFQVDSEFSHVQSRCGCFTIPPAGENNSYRQQKGGTENYYVREYPNGRTRTLCAFLRIV